MEFEEAFQSVLILNKQDPENRILRLECKIPSKYETNMNEFLEKFFSNDPFDIRPEDLDVTVTLNGKIRSLKSNRRPSTFLSIFRFLELYRIQLNSLKTDINTLANCYKKFLASELPDSIISVTRNQVLANILSAGRMIKRWNPQMEYLYRFTLNNINLIITESEAANGPGKGFINLRKIISEAYLNLTLQPYYRNLVNFCIICIAYTSKLNLQTIEFEKQTERLIRYTPPRV